MPRKAKDPKPDAIGDTTMTKDKLTPQERAKKFQAEYAKLCQRWQCQHVPFPQARKEGSIIIVEAGMNVMVNDE